MVTIGNEFNDAVAAELRAERGAKRLTVDQLANNAGMVKGTLLRYLNGQREIPIPALYHISKALGVEPQEVMDRASRRVDQLH